MSSLVLVAAVMVHTINLPACTVPELGMGGEKVPGEWIREAAPYLLTPTDEKGSIIPLDIDGRDYFVTFGGRSGAMLNFGMNDKEGPHLMQTIAIGPGELASFVCAAVGDA